MFIVTYQASIMAAVSSVLFFLLEKSHNEICVNITKQVLRAFLLETE